MGKDCHKRQESILAEQWLERSGSISLEKDFMCFVPTLRITVLGNFRRGFIYRIFCGAWRNCHWHRMWQEWSIWIFTTASPHSKPNIRASKMDESTGALTWLGHRRPRAQVQASRGSDSLRRPSQGVALRTVPQCAVSMKRSRLWDQTLLWGLSSRTSTWSWIRA